MNNKPLIFFTHPTEYKPNTLYKRHGREYRVVVCGHDYMIDKIHWFTEEGIQYSTRDTEHFRYVYINYSFRKKQPLYTSIQLRDKIKRKSKPDFSISSPFIVSKGRCKWDGLKCDLYLPVHYLTELGYTIEENCHEERYVTNYDRWIQTEYFDIKIESKRIDKADQRLNDLIKAIEAIPTDNKKVFEKELEKALNNIGIY
jgi:hypothetical protein